MPKRKHVDPRPRSFRRPGNGRHILVEKVVRELIFARTEKVFRREQIQRIGGDVFDVLDAVAREAVIKVIDKAIECHPSSFKTLEL